MVLIYFKFRNIGELIINQGENHLVEKISTGPGGIFLENI